MRRLFLKLIFTIQIFALVAAAIYCIRDIPYMVSFYSITKFRIGMAGVVFVALFYVFLIRMLVRLRLYERHWVWPAIFAVIIILQLLAIFFLRPLPVYDCRSTVEEAVLMSSNGFHMEAQNGYFERYANNYAFTIILAVFFRLMSFFGVENYWMCAVLANTLVIDLAAYIGVYLLRRISSGCRALVFLLLFAICPLTYVFTWYVYTNTLSILMMMLILLCLYRLKGAADRARERLLWSALLGVVLVFSYLIRVTAIFVFIAFVLCVFLCGKLRLRDIFRPPLPLCFLVLILSVLLSFGAYNSVENRCVDPQLREGNFPLVHWLAMGHNTDSYGLFSQHDEDFTDSIPGKAAKAEANLGVLQERLKEIFSNDPLGFYIRKLAYFWSDVGYAVSEYSDTNQTNGWLYTLLSGKQSMFFIAWVQTFMASVYLFSVWSVWHMLGSKHPPLFPAVLAVTFFGVLVFYTFWEVSAVHIVCFVPLLLMLAAYAPVQPVPDAGCSPALDGVVQIGALLLLSGLLIFPLGRNYIQHYDEYSVCAINRRSDLEEKLDNIAQERSVIQNSFTVPERKTARAVEFLVEMKESEKGCDYLFSLYHENGEQICSSLLDYRNPEIETGVSFYCTVYLPGVLEAGSYTFTIEAMPGKGPDGLGFIYAWYRAGADTNPGGDLMLNGVILEDRELQFNVR